MKTIAVVCWVGIIGCHKPIEVQTFGSLRAMMHQGQTGSVVSLNSLKPRADLYALGALSGLRGEVTILGGIIWLAYPNDDGTTRVERVEQSAEESALLVAARVSRWKELQLDQDVAFGQLDAQLEALGVANGVDVTKPFAIIIEGELSNLKWHVIDGRKLSANSSHAEHVSSAAKGERARTQGTMLGFFSKSHQGVFTHQGSTTHFHVVLENEKLTGHLDDVVVAKGARVRFAN